MRGGHSSVTSVRMFDFKDEYYQLLIDLDDDHTFVINSDGKEIGLKFDSSTYVHYKEKQIGKLRLPFNGEKPNIHFVKYNINDKPDTPLDTGISQNLVECYLDAEVFITKHLIETGFIKLEEPNG